MTENSAPEKESDDKPRFKWKRWLFYTFVFGLAGVIPAYYSLSAQFDSSTAVTAGVVLNGMVGLVGFACIFGVIELVVLVVKRIAHQSKERAR